LKSLLLPGRRSHPVTPVNQPNDGRSANRRNAHGVKLSIDEAIQKLEGQDQEFMVFANRATDAIHVVYKLPDGNYGVLNLNTAP